MPSKQRTWHVTWTIKQEQIACTLAGGCTEVGEQLRSGEIYY
jgi:hypothetical protein